MPKINKLLIIIRGLPGSGKTTLANIIRIHATEQGLMCSHYEADTFFMVGGVYKFDPEKIGHAHSYCKKATEADMMGGINQIIVSNTACAEWEYKLYIDMAAQYGYSVQVIDVHSEFNTTHNVPEDAMERMEKKWKGFNRELLCPGYGG